MVWRSEVSIIPKGRSRVVFFSISHPTWLCAAFQNVKRLRIRALAMRLRTKLSNLANYRGKLLRKDSNTGKSSWKSRILHFWELRLFIKLKIMHSKKEKKSSLKSKAPRLLVSEFMTLNQQVESKESKKVQVCASASCDNFYQSFFFQGCQKALFALRAAELLPQLLRPLTQLKTVGLHQMSQDLRLDKQDQQIKYMDFYLILSINFFSHVSNLIRLQPLRQL